MNLDNYLSYVLTLKTIVQELKDTDFINANKVKALLSPFINHFNDSFHKVSIKYEQISRVISLFYSDFENLVYFVKFDLHESIDFINGIYFEYVVYSFRPAISNFIIDGNSRPAIKVQWGYFNPDRFIFDYCVDPAILDLDTTIYNAPIPIYIQSHALARLDERMDCVVYSFLHFFIVKSLDKINITKTYDGNYLIEYQYNSKKSGYLKAVLFEGKLIIKTFLFLTNNGTPEGQLLLKTTGLEKLDKKYLEIDKLSTFIFSDIKENPEVKQLFLNAGCHSLFEFTKSEVEEIGKKSDVSTSELISRYLLAE